MDKKEPETAEVADLEHASDKKCVSVLAEFAEGCALFAREGSSQQTADMVALQAVSLLSALLNRAPTKDEVEEVLAWTVTE